MSLVLLLVQSHPSNQSDPTDLPTYTGRKDLANHPAEQQRLLADLEKAHLPLGVAFVIGFGLSTIAPNGVLLERFRLLLLDYCDSLA